MHCRLRTALVLTALLAGTAWSDSQTPQRASSQPILVVSQRDRPTLEETQHLLQTFLTSRASTFTSIFELRLGFLFRRDTHSFAGIMVNTNCAVIRNRCWLILQDGSIVSAWDHLGSTIDDRSYSFQDGNFSVVSVRPGKERQEKEGRIYPGELDLPVQQDYEATLWANAGPATAGGIAMKSLPLQLEVAGKPVAGWLYGPR